MKKIISFLLVMILFVSIPYNAFALSSLTTSYVYGFDYGDISTIDIAQQETMYLSNLGYTTYCNTRVSASFAVGISPSTNTNRMNSGVVAINGHAGPGSMAFYHSDSYLTAKKSKGNYYKFANLDMKNCKAIFFLGCKTASTERSNDYGVLTSQAVSNGARCSFGWKESVYTSSATKFRENLFYYLRFGYSIKSAASKAASKMLWWDSTRKYSIVGDGNTTLTLPKRQNKNGIDDNNIIDKKEVLSIIKLRNYRQGEKQDDGSVTYVRYINDVPTTESIDIVSDSDFACKTSIHFSDNDIEYAKKLMKSPKRIRVSVPERINNKKVLFDKITDSTTLDVICKINNDVKYVRIIQTEYISKISGFYYLDISCYDLNSGREIDYNEIIKSIQ